MLTDDQMSFMQDYQFALEAAFEIEDFEFLELFAMSPEFQDLFGDISAVEAYQHYLASLEA